MDLGALHVVAAPVEIPGAPEIAAVLPGLAEGKQEIHLGLRVHALGRNPFFHLADHRVIEAVGLEIGQAPVGLAEIGRVADAFFIGLDGRAVVPDGLQYMAKAEQCSDVGGPQLQAFPVRIDGLVRERGAGQRRGTQVVGLRQRGVERDRAVEAFQRLAEAVLVLA